MKKVLGVLFALAIFLLPIAWGVRAEDTVSTDQTGAADLEQSGGPFLTFKNFILKNFVSKGKEVELDKANADTAKNKLSGWREKIQEILKKLNNTTL